MALESRIPPTAAEWSWRFWVDWFRRKMYFTSGYVLWAQATTCCLKLSVNIGIDQFDRRNWQSAALIRKICRSFNLNYFFLPLRHSLRSAPLFSSFFTLKTMFLLLLKVLPNFGMVLSPTEFLARTGRQAITMATCGSLHLHYRWDHPLADFIHLASRSPQQWQWQSCRKQSTINRTTL